KTGDLSRLKVGHANEISFASNGKTWACVIQRHGGKDYSHWKRYRGGTAGQLWVDPVGKGKFHPLIALEGNLSSPLWLQDRIYFLSDHEGIGGLYSCTIEGKDLRTEIKHKEFYVRQPSTDGKKIAYHAGADLYVFDPALRQSRKVEFSYPSARPQRARKFVGVRSYLECCALHPNGHHLALSARGKAVALPNWEGGALYLGGKETAARYRQSAWLNDGERVALVRTGEERDTIEIYRIGGTTPECIVDHKDIGHILTLKESPRKPQLALTNHRGELIHVDLIKKKPKVKVLDESLFESIESVDWSLDGQWIAYSAATSRHISIIKIAQVSTGKIHEVTQPVLKDTAPSFSPCGRYLYFLGGRQFDPSYDTVHFDLSFPRGMRPYVILLQKDLLSPFIEHPKGLSRAEETGSEKEESPDTKKHDPKVKIDFEGIQNRILPFPVRDGIYGQILGVKGKALFTAFGQSGTLEDVIEESRPEQAGVLLSYDFETHKVDEVAQNISGFAGVSADREWMSYVDMDGDIRVLKSGEKGEDDPEAPPAKRGWIDLSRVDISISALQEWRQIFDEAWRLQKDFFWIEDMSDVNWKRVKNRYEPLLERIGARSELTDLLWEMQGELGTSHAYVVGGDLKRSPRYRQGLLGAKFVYDDKENAYRVKDISRGDTWKSGHHSPLIAPGVGLNEGDFLYAIDGQTLTKEHRPEMSLVNSADRQVSLEVYESKGDKKNSKRKTVLVKPLSYDFPARYRDWVEKNRTYVHEKSKGAIGYVHIPDMGPWGYSEFHRLFLPECDRDGLIVDVRFNGGGHVSSLILEKLAR
ncbi:Tricorn protease-like, partial [Stylophora pistillata]